MNIFLQELPVSTVKKNIYHKFKLYKGILFKDEYKISIKPLSTLSVIIDNIKDLFGLESFKRSIIITPSQKKFMIEYHRGYERSLNDDEKKDYNIYKIRFFRWLVGLPHLHCSRDIIARCENEKKTFISYREENLEYERDLNIDFVEDKINLDMIIKEIFYIISDINELKESILDIIKYVDSKYIFLADYICMKINRYGLLI